MSEFNASMNTRKLPGFVMGWAITDIVFSIIRLCIFPLTTLGFMMMPDGDPMKFTAIPEAMFQLLLFTFGMAADIPMLMKKQIGYTLGKAKVVLLILSFSITLFQLPLQLREVWGDMAQVIGMTFGALLAVFIRGILVFFYARAVKRFGEFINSGI